MSKTYDRVERCFLRMLMHKLGFAKSWVNQVMDFASSVDTHLLLMEIFVVLWLLPGSSDKEILYPSICLSYKLQMPFSILLKMAITYKDIHGMKASQSEPKISHLDLFTD